MRLRRSGPRRVSLRALGVTQGDERPTGMPAAWGGRRGLGVRLEEPRPRGDLGASLGPPWTTPVPSRVRVPGQAGGGH